MYVRIHWGKIVPGSWSEIEAAYAPLLDHDVPGLLGRFVTQDASDPESMFTLTFWKDAESVAAWEESADYRAVFAAAIRPFLLGSQSVSLSKVVTGRPRGDRGGFVLA